ncbi:MAG: histidine phosphatase family protein [Prolixibacteraceae bacterium]|nr:histidine phosphatase family protein [Prolixibacteraceae bacterium]
MEQLKRLIIVRHAKAERGGYDNDYYRELTERGVNDAHNVAKDLLEWDIVPGKMVSSPATRALTTARIFAGELNFDEKNIVEIEELYFEYTSGEFVELVQETPDDVANLFIFGHNPFMYYMAKYMCNNFMGDMPTCSTVVIDYKIERWKQAQPGEGNFFLHLYPKLYK